MDAKHLNMVTNTVATIAKDEWLKTRTAEKINTSGPPNPLTVPTETARMQVNAASFMTPSMLPSSDGIYSIGSVSNKIGNTVKALARLGGWGLGF